MAVAFVDEVWSSNLGTDVDDKGRISATASRTFNVFTQYASDDLYVIKLDPRVPVEKSRHPLFISLFCKGVQIIQRNPLHWEVVANYVSPPYRDTNGPIYQPTEVETFTITNDEPIDEDIEGNPIATANGERIYGVSKPVSDLGIRLNKRFRFFDPATFYTYIDCVNSDTFIGFPPGVLRVASISASDEWVDTEPYANVTVEIHARKPYNTTPEKSWWKRVRHEGFYVKKNGKVVRAKDGAGKDRVEPVMLDSDGAEKEDQTQADWLEFKVFQSVNFSSMGF
jgi:hypothetical protein